MKWPYKHPRRDLGKMRTVRKFLFFPKRLFFQWRWWEWAVIKQRYTEQDGDYFWRDIDWGD